MPDLIGRNEEVAAVEQWLSSLGSGLEALVVSGEAGIGKTAVWESGIELAKGRGATILGSSPAHVEAKLAYSGLGDLFREVPQAVLEELPAPQRRALSIALLRQEAGSDELDPRTVAAGLLSVLRSLAGAAPLVVAVDDAQWLDRATARSLAFALRRLDRGAVGVLTSLRADGGLPGATFVSSLPPERTTELRLGPLPAEILRELIASRLGRRLPRPLLARVERISGGNPFYAVEVARAVLAARDDDAAFAVPAELERILRARVRRLPAATREALLAAAASSSPAVALVGGEALAPAEEAGVLTVQPGGRVVFAHPLFREAIYASAATSARRAVHARLAAAVEDPEERARHLALAATAPDPAVARALARAARLAAARGAPDASASLLVRAAELMPPGRTADASRLRIDGAEYHFHAGEIGRSRAVLEGVLREGLPLPLRARALRLLAEIRLHDSSIGEALEILPQALAAAGEDAALRAPIEMDLAYAIIQTGEYAAAVEHAHAAAAHAERVAEPPGLVAEALAVKAVVDFFATGRIDGALLSRALALEEIQRFVLVQMRPLMISGILAWFTDDLAAAREQLERLRGLLVERGDEPPFLLTHLAGIELRAGALETALQRAREARQAAATLDSETFVAFALGYEAVALAYLGDAAGARAAAAGAIEIGTRTRFAIAEQWARLGIATLQLSLLDHQGARETLSPLVEFVETVRVGDPIMAFFLPDAVEALVGAGDVARAAPLAEMFLARGRALDRPWALATGHRCEALLNAARGELPAAAAALEAALEEHARVPMPLELARTLLVHGRVQRRLRRRREARESFARARELFERHGAPLWAERASEELARTQLRQAPSGLTATERRVAELAAAGATNREIAEQLFVSPKTVEANLARIYRKLGIGRRGQLGAALART